MYYIYQTNPVDFFHGLMPIKKVARDFMECPTIVRCTASGEEESDELFPLFLLAMRCARAVALAKGSYWEGDIRGEQLFVFAIPDPDASPPRLGLMWKQDNNGTTYICSPVQIPWIDQEELLTTTNF